MKNRFRIAALAILLAGGAVTGCRTSVNTVDPANPVGQPHPEAIKHTITDSSLSDSVVPVFYNKIINDAGIPVVQLQVMNQTRTVARVNYRVEWMDKNGMLITSPAPISKALVIEPGAIEAVKAVGPSVNAADARIRFQESKYN